jgi:hypothetical protein
MIIVCEPQCKGISHVEVNSGFLYGLSLAFPGDTIVFFAHLSHYRDISQSLKDKDVTLKNLRHIPINFNADNMFSIYGIISYCFLIQRIFDKTLSSESNTILFLSTSPIILYVLKQLKRIKKYSNICCTFVLHGELEDIANITYQSPYIPTLSSANNQITLSIEDIISKLIRHLDKIPLFLYERISKPFKLLNVRYSLLFRRYIRTKNMMMWRHSDQYKYISLSPHVTANAKKYLDTAYLNFCTITMPIVFNKLKTPPTNKYIKFAVFGYGDSSQMQKLLTLLSNKKITKPYVIKIISMDSRGTEGFPNIQIVGKGKVLTREQMETAAEDVDVFLNLYDDTRHNLGCSLSIFEALSHVKPVLHLSNPGYNYFNKPSKPIGYKVKTLSEFVDKLCDMIENYAKYRMHFNKIRKNIILYRNQYNVQTHLSQLINSITYIN